MAYKIDKIGVSGNIAQNDIGLKSISGYSNVDILPEFYEMEPAIVLDIILDDKHPLLNKKINNSVIGKGGKKTIDVTSFPDNYKDTTPDINDIDMTWIGRVLVRQCFSQQGNGIDKLFWAIPLDVTGVVEYPLINETVIVIKYFDYLYYTKRLNMRNFINNSGEYTLEKHYGINDGIENDGKKPVSLLTNKKNQNSDYVGFLGNYFLTNNKIRRLKKYEGDTSIESRFGQSIRFSAYDDNRNNDKGGYVDYKGNIDVKGAFGGGGNPMVLIRNRQRPIASDIPIVIHKKLPPIPKITEIEKNVGGLIEEDINHDGSSIHLTSGKTESKWKTTVYKSMFGDISEEQPNYDGITNFKYPKLNGDQIIINSDRLILSSRFGESFHYSKKRYGIVTDSECTLDAQDQVVITTNNKTVINSPAIYLGQYDETNEPALLGQTSVNWLFELCNWLKTHIHHLFPGTTDEPVQLQELMALQLRLEKLLSRRVFLTGGGFAPGSNGKLTQDYDGNAKAITINTITGEGVPGGFKGSNFRELAK